MNIAIDKTKLANVKSLAKGAHDASEGQMCAMEAAAWIAGEQWSDHPQCVCPVIAAFMRSWNDALPDEERTDLLLPLIPLTIGTRGDKALSDRRATMAADWLIRVHTPAWLRLSGLTEHADALSAMPEITDFERVPSLMPALNAARKDASAARAAARDAARDAAWDAARDAARAAAWAAAWDAARAAARDAARDAAWAAARDAAWDAARAAARDAARDALKDTRAELQASASDLVRRMCALEADL